MKGFPKYKVGDIVVFWLGDTRYTGTVYIVDKFGTYDDNSDVSYDIMVEDDKYITPANAMGECLFKHINERLIHA